MASKPEAKPLISTPVLIVGVVLLVSSVGLWLFDRYAPKAADATVITEEAKAYVRQLNLSGVEMKATENAIHQQVVEIVGSITNQGNRHLKSVSVHCIFYSPYREVVLRETVEIVRGRQGGLKPGETKPFRLPFDNLPQGWNQSMPQLVIAQILFG